MALFKGKYSMLCFFICSRILRSKALSSEGFFWYRYIYTHKREGRAEGATTHQHEEVERREGQEVT
jgi:hypothetical protein